MPFTKMSTIAITSCTDQAKTTVESPHQLVKRLGGELGFSEIGITHPDPSPAQEHYRSWIAHGRHASMDYMAEGQHLRFHPQQLVSDQVSPLRSIISARLPYLTAYPAQEEDAVIARYALGRDYHKTLRSRLQQLAQALEGALGPFQWRVFTDSAPVLEGFYAQQAGLGWTGKNTLNLTQQGSFAFLGEIFTSLDFGPETEALPAENRCGRCIRCLRHCPTGALVGPGELDARRCISYLTIEHAGSIPLELRPLIGQRIYGCDDCQWACPWNRFAPLSTEADFQPRPPLTTPNLARLAAMNEDEFLQSFAGSPIRRLGHERWLRNMAVALGNSPPNEERLACLKKLADHPSELVREHAQWAWKKATGEETT